MLKLLDLFVEGYSATHGNGNPTRKWKPYDVVGVVFLNIESGLVGLVQNEILVIV